MVMERDRCGGKDEEGEIYGWREWRREKEREVRRTES